MTYTIIWYLKLSSSKSQWDGNRGMVLPMSNSKHGGWFKPGVTATCLNPWITATCFNLRMIQPTRLVALGMSNSKLESRLLAIITTFFSNSKLEYRLSRLPAIGFNIVIFFLSTIRFEPVTFSRKIFSANLLSISNISKL